MTAPAQRTVLVVDDDADTRQGLCEILEDEGYRCEMADDGSEALGLLDDTPQRVDVVLLDLMMPRMDGWTVLRRMEADPKLRRVPVVVMSAGGARALSSLPAQQLRLAKPIDIDELLPVLREAAGVS